MYREITYKPCIVYLLALLLSACQPVAPPIPIASPVVMNATPAADAVSLQPLDPTRIAGEVVEPADGAMLPFQTIAQGDSLTADQETALLLLAQSPVELRTIAALLDDPVSVAKITDSNLSDGLVAAVFRGKVGSSGYGINIQSIQFVENHMQILVDLTEPLPDQMTADVISYPYHIVQIPLDPASLAANTLWTVLTADGEVLTTTRYP